MREALIGHHGRTQSGLVERTSKVRDLPRHIAFWPVFIPLPLTLAGEGRAVMSRILVEMMIQREINGARFFPPFSKSYFQWP